MGRSTHTTPDLGNSITIVGGQWTERVQEGTAGAESRKLTKGKNEGSTVWECKWPSLVNLVLISGKFVKPEGYSEEQAEIVCRECDTGELITLSLPYDSKYLKKFIMCLPKIDPAKPFNLELHLARGKSPTGADRYNLRVYQDGINIDTLHFCEVKKDEHGENAWHYYHDCPAPIEKRGGKWDFDDQNAFLAEYFERYMETYSPPSDQPRKAPEPVEDNEPEYDENGEAPYDDNDEPF